MGFLAERLGLLIRIAGRAGGADTGEDKSEFGVFPRDKDCKSRSGFDEINDSRDPFLSLEDGRLDLCFLKILRVILVGFCSGLIG